MTIESLLRGIVQEEMARALVPIQQELRELRAEAGSSRAEGTGGGPELISVKEAADLLGAHPSTVRAMVARGEFARHGTARLLRVDRRQVLAGRGGIEHDDPRAADEVAERARRIVELHRRT